MRKRPILQCAAHRFQAVLDPLDPGQGLLAAGLRRKVCERAKKEGGAGVAGEDLFWSAFPIAKKDAIAPFPGSNYQFYDFVSGTVEKVDCRSSGIGPVCFQPDPMLRFTSPSRVSERPASGT
jgi:hypothetical protein